jgi:NADPH:quinone reductase-like Zn-dependent oxidoreductase
MARIVRFYEVGEPDVLRVEQAPVVDPGPGEVRIKVQTLGLNRAECLFRRGKYLQQPKFPARIGYECHGTIDAVGADVRGWAPGDAVGTVASFDMSQYGVYGDTAVVPAVAIVRAVSNLSPVENAAIWTQYLTAAGALIDIARIGPGDCVVVTAPSSSTGVAAIQIAAAEGARVIAVSRTQAKRDALLALGADVVLATQEENLAESILAASAGRGHTVAFDPVVGSLFAPLIQAAAPGATIFVYGGLEPQDPVFPRRMVLSKALCIRGHSIFHTAADPAAFARVQAYVRDRLVRGVFKPVIAKTFALDEIAAAHRYMESNAQIGKIVATV